MSLLARLAVLLSLSGRSLRRSVTSTKNKFVQLALQETLRLAWESRGPQELRELLSLGLDITIAGDNDFYSQRAQVSHSHPFPLIAEVSQNFAMSLHFFAFCEVFLQFHQGTRASAVLAGLVCTAVMSDTHILQLESRSLPATLASLAQLPPFLHTGVRLPEVHKTGLGSSAALITSLVSALLLHIGIIARDSFEAQGGLESASEGRRLAHNVSQYIHCLAQGKVGSGFDVSSAVFGSQVYTRFDPQVIQPLMENHLVSKTLPLYLCTANTSALAGRRH